MLLNSHHSNLVDNFKSNGNYNIPKELSNTSCYDRVRNMNYAKEGKLDNIPKGKHLSLEQYSKLKTNNLENNNQLPEINYINYQKEKPLLNNNNYFYKCTLGEPIKNIKNNNINKK